MMHILKLFVFLKKKKKNSLFIRRSNHIYTKKVSFTSHNWIFSYEEGGQKFENKNCLVFEDPEPETPKSEDDEVLITSFNVLAAQFFTMNEAVAELRETRKINAFFATWNKVIEEVNEILENVGYS